MQDSPGWTKNEKILLGTGVTAIVLVAFFLIFTSPTINVNHGTGWDGIDLYNSVLIIMDMQDKILIEPDAPPSAPMRSTTLTKSLPTLILVLFFKATGIVPGKDVIIDGFRCLNLISIALSAGLLVAVAKQLQLSASWTGAFIVAVLFSWGGMTLTAYYPVMYDTESLVLAIGIWLAWLRGMRKLMVACFFLSLLVNPLISALALLLSCFRRSVEFKSSLPDNPATQLRLLALMLAAWVAFTVGNLVEVIFHNAGDVQLNRSWPMTERYVYISIVCNGVVMLAALYHCFLTSVVMLDTAYDKRLSRLLSPCRLGVLFAVLAASSVGIKYLFAEYWLDLAKLLSFVIRYIIGWLYSGGTLPLRPQLAHIVSAGAAVILVYAYWSAIVRHASRFGPGAMVLIIITAIIGSVNSETRQVPLLTVATLSFLFSYWSATLPRARIAPLVTGLGCVVIARPWWAYFADLPQPDGWSNLLSDQHGQEFFRFLGPWMTPASMAAHSTWIIPVAVVMVLAIEMTRRGRRR